MAQASASVALLADATRAARLRFWIVIIGVVVIAAFAGSSAYDTLALVRRRRLREPTASSATWRRRSPSRPRIPCRHPISCCATRLPGTQTEHPAPGTAADAKLAARAAGLPQVRVVTIIDEQGIPRFRSRELPPDVSSAFRPGIFYRPPGPSRHLGVLLSDPLITQIEHRPAIVMSRRLEKRDGTFDGVVQAVVDLEAFQRVYQAIDLGQGSAINLLRDDGTLVVRQPQAPQAFGAKFPELIAPASESYGVDSQPHRSEAAVGRCRPRCANFR